MKGISVTKRYIITDGENYVTNTLATGIYIVTSFCARIYGKGRTRHRTEQIINALERGDSDVENDTC